MPIVVGGICISVYIEGSKTNEWIGFNVNRESLIQKKKKWENHADISMALTRMVLSCTKKQ